MPLQALLPVWRKARERYQEVLNTIEPEHLTWRLAPGSNSIGFLIRHIAEVEYAFARFFFDRPIPEDVKLTTVGPVKDQGIYTDLADLHAFRGRSHAYLLEALESLPADKWDIPVETRIGTMTPREALGRLTYHTGYHAGQIGLIRKYGEQR